MYNYIVQQEDISILKQSVRQTYIKAEVLNSDMQMVATIEGNLIDDNFSCTEESAVRRTYNCTLLANSDSYMVNRDSFLWFDRYARISYGVKNARTNMIRWYTIGTFSFVDMSYSYSTTEKTLSLECSDLMASFDGTLGGKMTYESETQVTFKVTPGQSIETVLLGLMESAGIKNYSITGVDGYTIPYEIEWEHGTTYCEAWEKIRDLYDFWEFFFDETGRFIWRKTITGAGEDAILDDTIIKEMVINESLNDTFQNIYNATEVWGQELDIVEDDRYTEKCTGGSDLEKDNVFHITLDNFTYEKELKICNWSKYSDHMFKGIVEDNAYYALVKSCSSRYTYSPTSDLSNLPNNCFVEALLDSHKYLVFRDDSFSDAADFKTYLSNNNIILNYSTLDNFDNVGIRVSGAYGRYININDTINIPIYNQDCTELEDKEYKSGNVYVFRYRRTKSGADVPELFPNFYLMGQYQAHGYYEETGETIPYSVQNLGRKVVNVIENDELYSDEVCFNQAQYETYKSTAKQDSLSLETIIIPFLEPSQKIKYTPLPHKDPDEWIIQSFSWNTKSGTMNIELYRFLEDYSYVKRREQEDK